MGVLGVWIVVINILAGVLLGASPAGAVAISGPYPLCQSAPAGENKSIPDDQPGHLSQHLCAYCLPLFGGAVDTTAAMEPLTVHIGPLRVVWRSETEDIACPAPTIDAHSPRGPPAA